MTSNTLRELGWQPCFEQQVSSDDIHQTVIARVYAHRGSHVSFMTETGEISVATSIVDLDGHHDSDCSIAIGDWFLLKPPHHRAIRRLERKTRISRKAAGETVRAQLIAANFDTVFVVSSCNRDFNLSRLERYLAMVIESAAVPVIVLTKSDLCEDAAELRQLAESLHPGLLVETLDARDTSQTSVLEQWCGVGKTVALLGSSGVGKSTLANAMCGLDIRTNAIRPDDDKGRHTTTCRSMHRMAAGGWLIDNPGMRELQLSDCEQGVADLFEDLLQLAKECRFRNCSHQGDAGCALEMAVVAGDLDPRRLTNYLKLQSEQARNSASLASRRERDRKTGKLYKQIISDKQKRRRG